MFSANDDWQSNIPEARYTSAILLHECITARNYGGKSRTCILCTDEAAWRRHAAVSHFSTGDRPAFAAWADCLWQAGEAMGLMTRPVRAGGFDLWLVGLDAHDWTWLIHGGLEEGVIHLPE